MQKVFSKTGDLKENKEEEAVAPKPTTTVYVEVSELGQGKSFGELALLQNKDR